MDFTEAVRLAKAGNEAGYRYLYDATYKSKFYLALQYMKNEDAAQDVVQDAYIKAFAKLDTLTSPEAFPAWLGMIVANTAKNELAKKNPMLFSDMGTEEQEEDFENLIADEEISNQPELSYTRQETQMLVREMIDSLSDEQRVCVLMFHLEGESIRDIAAALGCSENTVKSRLNYGRKNLKRKAEELQKKGYKLFGIAPVVLLVMLLQKQETVMAADGSFASASAVSEMRIFQYVRYKISSAAAGAAQTGMAGGASAGMTGSAGAASAGTAAGTGLFAGMAGKILVGVVIAAAVGGGIGAVSAKLHYDRVQAESAQEAAAEPGDIQEPSAEPEPTDLPEATVTPEPTVTPEATPEPENDVADALEQYRIIISQADTYDYSGENGLNVGAASGVYRYALVMMEADDPVPTLLLARENTMRMNHIRVFQYDPGTGSVIQPPQVLAETNVLIAMAADGNGILDTNISIGTGDTEIDRVTLSGGSLIWETQWNGRMDQVPEELGAVEITWYDVNDLTALEEQLSAASGSSGGGEVILPSSEPVPEFTPSEPGAAEETLPVDGSRLVFTGTVNTYTHSEVLALQGIQDPNPGSDQGETYRLIVLDQPQTMELRTSDGHRSGEVQIIDVSAADGIGSYDGQHLTFSIDPEKTYWPGDTSLPYNQPNTWDVHVLG